MILEYLKHLKRKWYIFLLAVLVIGGAAYFGQSYLYAKEKGGAGKSIEVDVYRLLNIDVASLESTKTGETIWVFCGQEVHCCLSLRILIQKTMIWNKSVPDGEIWL